MTRAAEFCYIAEMNGRYLQGIVLVTKAHVFTKDPEMALRISAAGQQLISNIFGGQIGFRKVLVG